MDIETNQEIKYKWLEKKYFDCQQENTELKKRIKRLKKLVNERAQPAELYIKEQTAIKDAVEKLTDPVYQCYEHFMAIPVPQSYTDLQSKAQPLLCKYFSLFSKGIQQYIKIVRACILKGPISQAILDETTGELLQKIDAVFEKLEQLEKLLKSPAWTEDLNKTAIQIRKDGVLWLINTRDILTLLRKMLV